MFSNVLSTWRLSPTEIRDASEPGPVGLHVMCLSF